MSDVALRRLDDVAASVKSTNAGATQITFDIGFHDQASFERVAASGALSPAAVAAIYGIDPTDVAVFLYAPSHTIKITIPRRVLSGGIAERDFDGTQQFPPLLDVLVPG